MQQETRLKSGVGKEEGEEREIRRNFIWTDFTRKLLSAFYKQAHNYFHLALYLHPMMMLRPSPHSTIRKITEQSPVESCNANSPVTNGNNKEYRHYCFPPFYVPRIVAINAYKLKIRFEHPLIRQIVFFAVYEKKICLNDTQFFYIFTYINTLTRERKYANLENYYSSILGTKSGSV